MQSFRRITSKTVQEHNFIDKTSDIFTRKLLKYFKQTNWIHANPSKFNHVKNINFKNSVLSAYVETKKNKDAIKKLEDDITDPNVPYVFIMGRRGSGKTFFQNYFLNTKTLNLNKKNYTWIRVDHTKIYHYNLSSHSSKKRIDNIFAYIWSQLVFTYIRYSEDHYTDKDNRLVYDTNKNNIHATSIFYVKDLVFSQLDSSTIFSINDKKMSKYEIDKFCQPIKDALHEQNSLDGKPFFHENTEIIAKNILSQLKKTGNKLALFIDGIDNIDFKHNVRKEIQRYLDPLIKDQEKHSYFDTIIITSRSELDLPIMLRNLFTNRLPYDRKHLVSTKKFISYKQFWEEFFNKINNKQDFFDLDYNSSRINNFKLFIEKCPSIIINHLKSLNISPNIDLKIRDENDFCVLDDLYDGDIREMKDGLLQSFIYIEEYILNHNKHHKYTMKFNTILDTRQYIVLEAIFKNGMIYAPDIRHKKLVPPYRNLGFTNIFNPTEEIIKDSIIPPLLFLYILKYLSNSEYSSINQMQQFFNQNLKQEIYKKIKDYLSKSFEHLLEYNYVTYGRQDDECNNDTMSITTKGLIVYHLIFKNIDILHSNVYYGTIYDNLNLNFSAFNPDGTMYVTRTLENVAKYLYFLNILQNDMLKIDNNSIRHNELFLNLYTDELKTTYQKLYLDRSGGNINLPPEKKSMILNNLLSKLPACLHILEKKSFKEIIKLIDSSNIINKRDQRIKIIFEFIYLKNENIDITQCIDIIDDSKAITNYLNYTKDEVNTISKIMNDYSKNIKKYFFISQLCNVITN